MRIKVPPFNLFDQFFNLVPYASEDCFTIVGDAGYAILYRGVDINVKTAGGVGKTVSIKTKGWFNSLVQAGKRARTVFDVYRHGNFLSQDCALVYGAGAGFPVVYTQPHFGFLIEGGNIKSTSADLTTQEKSDTLAVWNDLPEGIIKLECIVDGANFVDFYINGVWYARHETHPPFVGNYFSAIEITMLAGMFGVDITVFRSLIQKEY